MTPPVPHEMRRSLPPTRSCLPQDHSRNRASDCDIQTDIWFPRIPTAFRVLPKKYRLIICFFAGISGIVSISILFRRGFRQFIGRMAKVVGHSNRQELHSNVCGRKVRAAVVFVIFRLNV